MKKTFRAVIAVGVLLAAAGLWLALHDRGAADRSQALDARDSAAEPVRPVELAGRMREPTADGGTPSAGAGLMGTVRRGGVPVPATVRVWRAGAVSRVNPTRAAIEDGARNNAGMMAYTFGMAPGAPVATGTAGADGQFALPGVPAGAYILWATDADGRMGMGHAVVAHDGLRVRVDIAIRAGEHALRVRVLRRADVVYRGAVSVLGMGGPSGDFSGPLGSYETDAEGRVTVPGLTPGPVILAVRTADGLLAYRGPLAAPAKQEILWILEAAARPVRGRVLASDDGSPVAGAEVQVMGGDRTAGMLVLSTRTSADGRFDVLLPAAPSSVQVSAAGFAPGNAAVKGEEVIELRLDRLSSVRGRVVEKATGRPVEGVRILASSLGRRRRGPRALTAVSGADGGFELTGLAPGSAMVFALGSGWISDGLWDVKKDGFNPLAVEILAEGTQGLELRVVRAARVEGVVLDAAGGPVEAALVTPHLRGGPLVPSWHSWRAGIEGVAVTEADGSFVLDSLVPARSYVFEAGAADRPSARTEPTLLAAEGPNPRIEIRLPAERYLDVVVTDRTTGAAIADARVQASEVVPNGSRNIEGKWSTGEDGHAPVGPLPAGTITIRVRAAGYIVTHEDIPVADAPPGTTPLRVGVQLESGVTIRGRVEAPEGLDAVRASIDVHRLDGSYSGPDVQVTADGTFRIGGLVPGRYRLRADILRERTRYQGSVETEAPAEGVVVRIEGRARPPGIEPESGGSQQRDLLEIEIVGLDGKPLAHGQVTVYHPGGTSGTGIGMGGRARVRLRPGGEIHVEVYGLPHRSGKTQVGAGLYGPYPGTPGLLRIQLEAALETGGHIVGLDGAGIQGVRVAAAPENPRRGRYRDPFRNVSQATHTDAAGAFVLRGLKAGEYLLRVGAPQAYVTPEPVAVVAGDKAIRVTLRTGAMASVRVLDWQGEPVAGAHVAAWKQREDTRVGPTGPADAEGTCDAEGVAVLRGLDADAPHRLRVSVSASLRQDLLGHQVGDWRPKDDTIRLRRAYVTKGVVHDLHGAPAAGVTVWYRVAGESGASGTGTDKAGRFTIGPHGAAELLLQALPETSRPITPTDPDEAERTTWTAVKAGRHDVELKIDLGVELHVRIRPWTKKGKSASLLFEEPRNDLLDGIPSVGATGEVRLRHLDGSATYTLWVNPDDEGYYVHETGIRGDAGEVTLTSRRGRTVRGRIDLPEGLDPTKVYVSAHTRSLSHVQVRGAVGKDGSYEIRGVPDGDWKIQASWAEGFSMVAVADIPASGTVDLILER